TTSLPKPSLPVQTAGGSVGTDGPQKIRTISFSTLSGEVVDVKVPNIIRPGDQISFSVTPKKSSSTLDGAVVDVQDKKSDFKNKLFTIIVPAGLASFPLLIKDNNGTTLARTDIPVNVPRIPSPGNNIILPPQQTELPKPNSPGSFAPLNYCQPGQPLTINGFFDGNATNTNVSINNIPVEIIAESENGSFVQVPDGLNAGKGTIKIEEGGVSESMPIQVVTVNMSSNKTLIEKNGTAKVDIVLDGLGNVDLNNNNFKLELINSSPEAIAFRDANTNTLSFDLNNANVSNGIAKLSTNIKGIATGPYSIRAELTSTTCTECWTQYEICVAQVEAEEKQCYKDCDKNNGGISCYLACSAVARIKEAECFAQYLGCVRKKLGN
ncbi:MAG TPA: hypothetical protein VI548_11635, partial [Chitinophagaceae bacterium]|nr:hypothetical protein [Chitinophagaceae bacterium]